MQRSHTSKIARIAGLVTSVALGAAHALTPPDPGFSYQNLYLGPQVGGINAYVGWDYHFKGTPVTVAVIDSGYLPHPEFENRVLPGYDLVNQGTFANEQVIGPDGKAYGVYVMNGASPIAGGLDADLQTSFNSEDRAWHGTKVAGLILAASNQVGVTGLNPTARLLPIRVARAGDFAPGAAAQAIRWAVGLSATVNGVALPINPNPAKVLNLSLGGDTAVPNRAGSIGCSDEYQDAIDAAVQTGAVVVVAAGNYYEEDVKKYMPANCKNVVVVGGSNPYTGDRAIDISSFGAGVTISAPAAGMHTTTAYKANGTTQYLTTYESVAGPRERNGLQGTSFAAPLVSGTLALMFSYRPQLSATEAVAILKSTARPFPAGSSCYTQGCGTGVLNVGAAMAELTSRYPSAPTCSLSASNLSVPVGVSTTYTISGTNLPAGARGYWYGTKNNVQDVSGQESIPAPGSNAYVNSAGMQGTYVRYAVIKNTQGATVCTTNSVSVTYDAPVVTCSLSASSTNVPSGSSTTYTITGNNLPAGARGYWFGTKNGVQDASGQESIPAPGSNVYMNNAGMQGTYMRFAQIRDAQGNTVCTTNSSTVTYQAQPAPTCSLSGPSVVARNASYTYTVSGSNLPAGSVGYWSGTKNGVTDAINQYAGGVPSSFSFVNGGWVGNYVRSMSIVSPSGTVVCVTNSVSTTLQ
ncbi:S8 family serine peptidase [Chitinolyticbacter meiyuanensis]|uniref:S8 family serine peptidase n=1 Tax=Chitinolyticbacter meiyuanensis TaxID=682798 RepID=UPI0011E5BCBD|nr:S8 family serine peptidase [Chitinolyticbacter meiyuanensis]